MNGEPHKPFDEEEEPTFFQKFRVPIIGGALVLAVAVGWLVFPKDAKPKKHSSVSTVSILPPLPPPPPTPPPTPPPDRPEPEPQEVKDAPEFVEESMPDSPPEPQSAPEEAPMGSNIQGDGSDGFGLVGKGGGGMIGGKGIGGSGGGGTKFGWYAGKVQSSVASALRNHRRTRSAKLSIKVRIWADSSGRVTRASLEGTSGDPATDSAITNEILTGLQLPEAPPQDMPMPIVMRISAKRPN